MRPRELLLSPTAYMPAPGCLDGLSAARAGVRVEGASHSIVEILAHLVYWQTWFLDRCAGIATPMAAKASLGWPEAAGADWETLRERFVAGLARAAELADGESAGARRLDPPIEFPPLDAYTVADAMTHLALHNAHHLGQIVTLRQILGAWPPPGGSWSW